MFFVSFLACCNLLVTRKICMVNSNLLNTNVFCKFFKPLIEVFHTCRHKRDCPELPDLKWLQLGISRVLLDAKSGRGFLQQYSPFFKLDLCLQTFFASLRSKRRLSLATEANDKLARKVADQIEDPLAQYDELRKFHIYAGDGHWHGASPHEARKDGKKWSAGHFYLLNLRSHALTHMKSADQVDRKHEHDMRALKRAGWKELRKHAHARTGEKVLIAWDSACTDFAFWAECKQQGGVYFLTRIKENASYEINDDLPIDRKDSLNRGVTSDQRIIFDNKDVLRKIECIDPESGDPYTFLTNEMTLRAGILVQIYRMRWDIEKVFDQIKNALLEQKAWAKSMNAKSIQAQMICMAHNLSLLMENTLEQDHGVVNEAEEKRREDRLKKMKKKAKTAGRQWSNVYDRVRRFTKRSLKFFRTLRAYFFLDCETWQMAARLRQLYAEL